jgi:hypothetical protein
MKEFKNSLILVVLLILTAWAVAFASHGRETARFLTQLENFHVNVTSAGTPVQLPSHHIPNGIDFAIKAKPGNTGVIRVGKAAASTTSSTGWSLDAKDGLKFGVPNTNMVWIDATVSGEGIEVIFEK